MNASKFIFYNGEFYDGNVNPLPLSNRAFRYGDGLFETGRIINGVFPLMSKHLERIFKYAELLKLPHLDALKQFSLEEKIKALIDKNKVEKGGKIRITFFRNGGDFYAPTQQKTDVLIEIEHTETNCFDYNTKGLLVDIFPDLRKPVSYLSNAKTNNCLVYVMAAIYAAEKGLDNCILQNDQFNVIEAMNSNLFLAVNGVLYTPPVKDACLDGVMRTQVIELALLNGMKVYETTIKPNDLLRADELFLTNGFFGVNWVGAYRSKRYFNATSEKLQKILNDTISDPAFAEQLNEK